MMWVDDGGWGAGQWVVMSLMMLVFWGGLIALVVWLFRTNRSESPAPPAPPARTPDQMLDERFAKGEIDEEEFTRRRELLHAGAPPKR